MCTFGTKIRLIFLDPRETTANFSYKIFHKQIFAKNRFVCRSFRRFWDFEWWIAFLAGHLSYSVYTRDITSMCFFEIYNMQSLFFLRKSIFQRIEWKNWFCRYSQIKIMYLKGVNIGKILFLWTSYKSRHKRILLETKYYGGHISIFAF